MQKLSSPMSRNFKIDWSNISISCTETIGHGYPLHLLCSGSASASIGGASNARAAICGANPSFHPQWREMCVTLLCFLAGAWAELTEG